MLAWVGLAAALALAAVLALGLREAPTESAPVRIALRLKPRPLAPAIEAAPVAAPHEAAPVAPGFEFDGKIAWLLRAALADRKAGRYTSPPGANAVERYRSVLALRPDQADALRGLDEMGTTLRTEAGAAIDGAEFERARTLIDEIASFLPLSLGDLEQRYAKARELALAQPAPATSAPAVPPLRAPERAVRPRAVPAPLAAAAPAPTPRRTSSRCADILGRFGLGEDLSAEDARFLREQC